MREKLPIFIAVAGMFGGVFIAIIFGVNEEFFKDRIQSGLRLNEKINAIVDTEKQSQKLKQEADKCWRYYQRFHFHATGIGAMSLSVLLLLLLWGGPAKLKLAASYSTAVGGYLYPFVWLFAAIYGPEWGRSEAKESFAIFGYMGGLFLLGLVLTGAIVLKYPRAKA